MFFTILVASSILLFDFCYELIQSNTRILDGDCKGFHDHLFDTNSKELNSKILICLFWRSLEAFITTAPEDVSLVGDTYFLQLGCI